MSASLPTSSVPTLSETPICFAGLIVMALNASYGSIPAFTARPAQSGRYCSGVTGESVMMETWQPFAARIPGVVQDLFCSSNLLAWVSVGPTAIGISLYSASLSAMRWPSVQCSSVSFRSNSFAMRIAVRNFFMSEKCSCCIQTFKNNLVSVFVVDAFHIFDFVSPVAFCIKRR